MALLHAGLVLDFFSPEIGQYRSTRAHIGEEKKWLYFFKVAYYSFDGLRKSNL